MNTKVLLAFAMMAAVAAAQLDYTLSDIGCEDRAEEGVWCKEISPVINVSVVFTDDIYCDSFLDMGNCTEKCSDVVTQGCYTTFKLEKDTPFEIRYTRYLEGETTNEREYETLKAGEYDAALNPDAVDLSECSVTYDEMFFSYAAQCAVNNTPALISGAVVVGEDDAGFIIEEIGVPASINLMALLMENIVYVVLLVVIAIILIWAAIPKFRKKAQ